MPITSDQESAMRGGAVDGASLEKLGFRHWNDQNGTIPFECWYRIGPDGQVDILARGHRIVVPVEAVPLLPEDIARVVLTAVLERPATADSLDTDEHLHMPALANRPELREKLPN